MKVVVASDQVDFPFVLGILEQIQLFLTGIAE
jgi:hypothetical protein